MKVRYEVKSRQCRHMQGMGAIAHSGIVVMQRAAVIGARLHGPLGSLGRSRQQSTVLLPATLFEMLRHEAGEQRRRVELADNRL
jgi:hypothetical protein